MSLILAALSANTKSYTKPSFFWMPVKVFVGSDGGQFKVIEYWVSNGMKIHLLRTVE
ncbi:hypothetical protein EMIT0196P_80261 [Pseudomonas chlororaphis]